MTAVVSQSEPLLDRDKRAAIRCRTLANGQTQELFITCCPAPDASPEEALQGVMRCVESHGAQACRQRVFVPARHLEAYRQAHRRSAQPPAVPTQWLISRGDHAAIQLYAVAGASDWTALTHAGSQCGWSFRCGESTFAVTTGISGCPSQRAAEQARRAFEAGEQVLSQAGMSLHDVARTWIFMDDILAWYGELNAVRNRFFADRGLLSHGQSPCKSRVPASTGIGLSPAGGVKISIEFQAVHGAAIDHLAAAGRQRSAYEYGSAFSRATELASPAGKTLFVSGTAAIDPEGRTCLPNDIEGQITMTLQNVCAIFQQRGYASDSVVEAVAYCKNREVENVFRNRFRNALPWPWVIAVGDVCRSDLLFEVEATAVRPEEG